jgi:hypothetical protein
LLKYCELYGILDKVGIVPFFFIYYLLWRIPQQDSYFFLKRRYEGFRVFQT